MPQTFIIAEAGVNHNGDINLAKQLIDKAVWAGVDAVKFQTWKTELIVSEQSEMADYQKENTGASESQFQMLKKLELSYDDFRELKAYCDKQGILFLSTPDEEQSADFLNELQDIFKIGSGELNNFPFLAHIASYGKEIILSTGMAEMEQIERALHCITQAGLPLEKITVLHANTQYPTPMHDVNLKAMQTIADTFGVKVGYSDHTMGIEVPIASVALGAEVIEKHFTLDPTMAGPDHKASLSPGELKAMVQGIRHIEQALGDGKKRVSESEKPNIAVVRKKILAKHDIKQGETLSEENLILLRADEGISADQWFDLIGTKATRNYTKGEAI